MEVLPYVLDRLVKYYYDLTVTIDIEKKLKYHFKLPDNELAANTTAELSTLETLIRLFVLTKHLKDEFLASCVLAKLRHNLHNGFFELSEFLDGVRKVYKLDVHDEGQRLLQKIFLTAAVKHSVSLCGGSKRTLFVDLLRECERFGYEYTLAKGV